MNRREAIAGACEKLTSRGIEDARLEAEILLRHVLDIGRVGLYSDFSKSLKPQQIEKFVMLVNRRLSGEPSAYITGHREFFGLDFIVDRHVLIPRPETELLVETALTIARQRPVSTIADIGTGCGAIAIALAINLPEVQVFATDISQEALEVARENCVRHGVAQRVQLLRGDLLGALPRPVDIIVANLPYVRDADLAGAGAPGFEPRLALAGGEDGTGVIGRISQEPGDYLAPGGTLLLEIGQGQSEAVVMTLRTRYPMADIVVEKDLADIERMVVLRLTPAPA